MKQTISREVCTCKDCGNTHVRKLDKKKKGAQSKGCEHLDGDYCTLQQQHKCDMLLSGNYSLCAIKIKG